MLGLSSSATLRSCLGPDLDDPVELGYHVALELEEKGGGGVVVLLSTERRGKKRGTGQQRGNSTWPRNGGTISVHVFRLKRGARYCHDPWLPSCLPSNAAHPHYECI
eukprot:TRINITY_DN1071_c0_g1_i2.p1 TRINITY_DN1071_c0_g1~~TRINITY_DN1071_c0_g1_i2.p1  ORF type:complete len:107 (+),score=4.45 TRINITY_DN1071_c0_g1_i2:28-348(+)